jgi:peptide/nickel transport system substrate-binding protein
MNTTVPTCAAKHRIARRIRGWPKPASLIRLVVVLALVVSGMAGAQSITIAISEGMPGFDPGANNRTIPSYVYPNLFDSLIHKDPDGALVPGLATAWEAAGASAWRITLRPDVRWHDGEPFTAADVKFTIERIATTPELARHILFSHVVEVEIVNDLEVVVRTERPDPLFPLNLVSNGAQILPRHHVEGRGIDTAAVQPIGTGPYRFVEYRPDDRLILEANDDYWGGAPVFLEAIFRVIGENTTAVSELITGGIHMTAVAATDRDRVESNATTRLVAQPTNRVVHWTFNVRDGQVTADPLVREAIDYAIDDAVFVEVLEDGFGSTTRVRSSPVDSFGPMQYYGTYLYDPERAVELLQEAGFGPNELHITLMGANDSGDRAELTAAMLEAVGIRVTVQLFESGVWSSRYWNAGQFTNMAAVGSSNSTFYYGNTLTDLVCPTGVHSFRSGWCHEEFSQLVTEANSEMDPDRRQALLNEATEIVLRERPQIYMYNTVNFIGIANDVEYQPRADGHLIVFDARPAAQAAR